ncbi:ABC transporter permease [Streptomyces sp. UNOC14_S4]|uniref:ABC transporter permease n=1 Tax=Streptomyces sp. UNOC14_S4 TaxID=2872340 RepID=UPI001E4536F5|nr:ABC transporter permease [Streptomyces sp. UNOC14_S4]MCC3771109.1 ABC transporter permease [Streptomyces sp. UNOC14_S4]
MLRTAVRNLLAHKTRLMMTALAVLLGTAFVSGTLIFSDTVGGAYRAKTARSLDDVAVSVTQGHGRPAKGDGALDTRVVDKVRALPGVTSVRPSVDGVATVADKDGNPAGSEWGSVGANYVPGPGGKDSRYPVKEGRGPATADEIALDAKTAAKAGAKLGGPVRLAVDGPVVTKKLVGIVGTRDPRVSAGGSLALFDTATAQQLFGKPGQFGELVVSAAKGADQEALARAVKDALPQGFDAKSGKELAAEQSKAIDKDTSSIRKTLLVFAGISLFVGVFIIANTFTMLIAQRTREIALLRAVGASRRQVVRSVLVEAGLLGLAASAVGFVLGIGIAAGLRPVLNSTGGELPDGPLVVAPGSVLAALAVGVVVTVVAAWLPSRKAARIAPVEALASVDQAPTARSLVVRNSIGAVLTGLGLAVMLYVTTLRDSGGLPVAAAGSALTVAGVIVLAPLLSRPFVTLFGKATARFTGVSGKLAGQNALRNPRRTAATASALMIGLTLITGLTVVAVSANQGVDRMSQQDLTADYKVSSATYHGFSPDVAKTLAGQPGVAAAVPLRLGGFDMNNDPAGIQATADVPALTKVVDLKVTGGALADVRGKDAVAVSEKYAREHGLKVGSTLPMDFADGKRETPRVAAVYADNDVLVNVLGSTALVDPHLEKVRDDEVYLKAAPGRADKLPAEIKKALGANPLIKVQSQDDLRRAAAGNVDSVLYLMYGLLGMAVVIAVIGVVNTLAMSVFERTREIGMLRAIGLARTGIKQMVRLESVMIALFGAVLGTGTGIFLAWAGGHLLRSSFPQYTMVVPWGRIAVFLLLALAVGVLAAVWPARRAAKLNMLESIGAQ